MSIKAIYNNDKGALKNVALELNANDLKELWRNLALLEALPTECGLCGSQELYPSYRSQPHEYYEITCRSCGGEVKFGKHQNTAESLFFDERQEWRIPPQRQAPQASGNTWESAAPTKPSRPPQRPAREVSGGNPWESASTSKPSQMKPIRDDDFPPPDKMPF